MPLPTHAVTFRYAKQIATARYVRIDDVRPATVEIKSLYFAGEEYTRAEAEMLQYGNDQTLWDEADHRCWLDAYGLTLPELKRVSVALADAEQMPEFQAAMAHAAAFKTAAE